MNEVARGLYEKSLNFKNVAPTTSDSVFIAEHTTKTPSVDFKKRLHCEEFIVQELQENSVLEVASLQIPFEEREHYSKQKEQQKSKREKKFALKNFSRQIKRKNGNGENACVLNSEAQEFKNSVESSLKKLESILGKEESSLLSEFLLDFDQKANDYSSEGKIHRDKYVLEKSMNKDQRKKLHILIKEDFPFHSSETVEQLENNKTVQKFVITNRNIEQSTGKKRNWVKSHYINEFFRGTMNVYLHFTLFKKNLSTTDAISILSEKLWIKPRFFTFCGNKDKHALTTQRMCVKKMSAKRILNAIKGIKNISVGDFLYSDKPLKLGKHSGNKFTVTLRGVEEKNLKVLDEVTREIAQRGFINYFGLQRFGTKRIPTHLFGKLALQQRWEELISLIIFPEENPKKEFRKKLLKGEISFDMAEELCPRFLYTEKRVLNSLSQSDSFRNAFNNIDRRIRSMFIHSFQSYIWNAAASERFRRFGPNVVEGDLVLNFSNGLKKRNGGFYKKEDSTGVIMVTKEDVANGVYNIKDVVLPIISKEAILPGNCIANTYHQVLKENQVTLDMFEKLEKDRSLMIFTDYRELLVVPKDVRLAKENEVVSRLRPSDKKDPISPKLREEDPISKVSHKDKDDAEKGNVFLEFSLPRSSYATVLLWEISKS